MKNYFNKFFAIGLMLIITFLINSCQTLWDDSSKKRNRRSRYTTQKSYKYRRPTPLGKKYPDYQPFRPVNSTNNIDSQMQQKYGLDKIKKFVIVANFADTTDKYYENIDKKASSLLQDKLKTSKQVVLEDTKLLYGVVENSKPGVDKNQDLAIAKLISKNINLSSLITGKINHLDFNTKGNNIGLFRETKYFCEVNIDIRIIDINLQKIIYEENITGTSEKSISHFFSVEDKKDYHQTVIESALNNAFDKISWKLISKIEKIGWKGKIAKVDKNKIYINGGLKTGLTVGDILLVTDLGELIFNPDTGQAIGRAPGNIKGTLRIVDFFGNDGAITVVNSGSDFKTSDFVELQ